MLSNEAWFDRVVDVLMSEVELEEGSEGQTLHV